MKLQNYTSTVPMERSVAEIEKFLVQVGATGIAKEYKDGILNSLKFQVNMPDIGNHTFQIPAKVDVVYEVLTSEISRPRRGTLEKIKEQSERTAWKIVRDWVESQCTMIKLRQAEAMQVFLPYLLVSKNETLYQRMSESKFKLLN